MNGPSGSEFDSSEIGVHDVAAVVTVAVPPPGLSIVTLYLPMPGTDSQTRTGFSTVAPSTGDTSSGVSPVSPRNRNRETSDHGATTPPVLSTPRTRQYDTLPGAVSNSEPLHEPAGPGPVLETIS